MILKFRAWLPLEEKMVEVNGLNWEIHPDGILRLHFSGPLWDMTVHSGVGAVDGSESFGYELMQFTGETDKNGKEIYESDIVKISKPNYAYDEDDSPDEPKWIEIISYIEYRNHGFWVHDESFGWEGEDLWDWELIEVIGNIYENPEILKENKR
jgi:uncharacterized phage protein (TIGR01671 family)